MLWTRFLIIQVLLAGCGPHAGADDVESGTSGDDATAADDACGEGSCPEWLSCGEFGNVCEGGFGIHPCIDGKCGPAPGFCHAAYEDLRTCTELCAVAGADCVARACEGVTAFSYPGPPHLASGYDSICGKNTEEVKDVVTRYTFDCDEELPWSDEVSLFQCCCDHPDQ